MGRASASPAHSAPLLFCHQRNYRVDEVGVAFEMRCLKKALHRLRTGWNADARTRCDAQSGAPSAGRSLSARTPRAPVQKVMPLESPGHWSSKKPRSAAVLTMRGIPKSCVHVSCSNFVRLHEGHRQSSPTSCHFLCVCPPVYRAKSSMVGMGRRSQFFLGPTAVQSIG